MIVMVSK